MGIFVWIYLEFLELLPVNKTEKNPHAKSKTHSFTVVLIIIPVKLVDSISSTRGTNNTTY
jgi:hypothetical protein